jgi:isopenicillin-N epimerase
MIVSWGWIEGHTFVGRNQWQGTRDLAAFLSVPAAIDFQAAHDWENVRACCHDLARSARRRVAELTDCPPIVPDGDLWFNQMVAAPLPPCDPKELQRRLYDEHRIEVPITGRDEQLCVRASFQGYNTADDLEALMAGLEALLPRV